MRSFGASWISRSETQVWTRPRRLSSGIDSNRSSVALISGSLQAATRRSTKPSTSATERGGNCAIGEWLQDARSPVEQQFPQYRPVTAGLLFAVTAHGEIRL